MNDASNSTTGGARPSLSIRLGDLSDILATCRYFNEVLHMASGSLMNIDATNALQAVSSEIEERLLTVRDRLDEIREELQ
ncbi:hypothetical protein GOD01_03385 [Sinorhizobium medicae]|nr:hypothetical protein [Sinorhizobium medicae]